MALAEKEKVILGRIVGLFGVRGWIKVFSYTDPRTAILDYRTWWLDQEGKQTQVTLAEGKQHGKSVIARIDGIDDRDAASEWLEAEISVPRTELPDPGDGSFYWADLEGLLVVNLEGQTLGRIIRLLETGANDVLVVKGDQEVLIPFVPGTVIKDVDLASGRVTVEWDWD